MLKYFLNKVGDNNMLSFLKRKSRDNGATTSATPSPRATATPSPMAADNPLFDPDQVVANLMGAGFCNVADKPVTPKSKVLPR